MVEGIHDENFAAAVDPDAMRQLLARLPGRSLLMCGGVNPVVLGRYAPFTTG